MLIKTKYDETSDLQILQGLLKAKNLSAWQTQQIQKEIKNIRSGNKGEAEAAYEIDFYFKDSENWAVIHDLRLEIGNDTAQFDHLLIIGSLISG